MKYRKLPIVLLSSLSSFKMNSTDSIIAKYLLDNLHADLSVNQIAQETHVGIASVSRFVRHLGLNNFSELRDLMSKQDQSFDYIDSAVPEEKIIQYTAEAMKKSMCSIHMGEIKKLVKEIKNSKEIAIFGLGKAECAAICLQTDLFSFDKTAFSTIQYKEQIEYIKNASLDTLIIIFSATSSYFEYYDVRLLKKKMENMNIWFIGSGNKPDYIHHSISYTQSDQLLAHPTQLMYIAQLIAQVYAREV